MRERELVNEFYKQSQQILEDEVKRQLSGLIEQGLLVMEYEGPTLITDPSKGPYHVNVSQKVRLKLRDQEVLDEKYKEIAELKSIIDKLRLSLNGLEEWKK